MALVAAVGKPADAQTFGAYADRFQDAVLGAGSRYQQIHVLFDRYKKSSIKAGTRERRTRTIRSVRRVIENKNVPLPNSWSNFLALPENKENQISVRTFNCKCTSRESHCCCRWIFRQEGSAIVKPIG
jgi:hypothetical protein